MYLFTCSVNKDGVCCDLLPPPISSSSPTPTKLRMKNPFELWEQPPSCFHFAEERNIIVANANTSNIHLQQWNYILFSLWATKWACTETLNLTLLFLLCEQANGNEQNVFTLRPVFIGLYYEYKYSMQYHCTAANNNTASDFNYSNYYI